VLFLSSQLAHARTLHRELEESQARVLALERGTGNT
jgi:hypothetical protein